MNLPNREEKTANLSIAGVLVVGIVFGCATYRKVAKWQKDEE